jgi:hypothetical protein
MHLKAIGILSLVILAGCRDYEKHISDARTNKYKYSGEIIFDGEIEPPFPNETDNNKTLLGTDSNNNGVRDDLDIWINYVGLDRNHRFALRELVREEAARLKAGELNDSDIIAQSAKNFYDAQTCALFFERDLSVEESPVANVAKLIYNSKLRLKSYETYHSRSIVFKSNNEKLNGNNGYIVCKFQVENLKIYFRK